MSHNCSIVRLGLAFLVAGLIPGSSQADDGTTVSLAWEEVMPTASWVERYAHATLSHRGKIWIMGGGTHYEIPPWAGGGLGTLRLEDIWCSPDGAEWAEVGQIPWRPGALPGVFSFNGKIWAISEKDNPSPEPPSLINAVWSSENGYDWTLVSDDLPWPLDRVIAQPLVFHEKMWLVGDGSGSGVWWSVDGEDWTSATLHAPWAPRGNYSTAAFAGKMWVLGGIRDDKALNDVWSSENGADWTKVTDAAPWTPRYDFRALACDGKMWVFGGETINATLPFDIWCSADGRNWTEVPSPWTSREDFAAVVHEEQIWVLGGIRTDSGNISGLANDVWRGRPISIPERFASSWILY